MRLTISLDDELYGFVRARGKREDKSMSAVITEALRRMREPEAVVSLADRWPTYTGPVVSPLPDLPTSTGALDLMFDLENDEALRRQ